MTKAERVVLFAGVVTVVILQACGFIPTETGQGHGFDPPRLQPSVTTINPTTVGLSLTPVNSMARVGPFSIGSFPRTTLIRLRASGGITPYINWGDPPPLGLKGTSVGLYDAGGLWGNGGCTANVVAWFTNNPTSWGFCYAPGVPRDFDVAILVRGDGSVSWEPGPSEDHLPECGGNTGNPCYLYSDGTALVVTVDKIGATVTFAPDRTVVQSGGQASFGVSINPTQFDGVQMPFQIVDYWRFQPDVGSLLTVCIPDPNCSMFATGSGTISTIVIAQGDSLRLSGRVVVNACQPTGEPEIDDPDFRKQFLDQLALGMGASPKIERGGWGYERPGMSDTLVYHLDPNATSCLNDPGTPNIYSIPGATRYSGVWHIHPLKLFDPMGTCKNKQTGQPFPPNVLKFAEPDSAIAGDVTALHHYWEQAGDSSFASWILTANGKFYKVDKAHPEWFNAQRFRFDSADPNRCFIRIV